jgi:hypothetical protein
MSKFLDLTIIYHDGTKHSMILNTDHLINAVSIDGKTVLSVTKEAAFPFGDKLTVLGDLIEIGKRLDAK